MNIPASGSHITVLLQESVAMLQPALNEGQARRCVDVTGGRGGHSAALLEKLQHRDLLLILDRDPSAIAVLKDRFADDDRVLIRQARFSEIRSVVESLGWENVDAILADLGVSSPQLDEAERGFSFLRDGPLDMRMDPDSGISAAEWLNSAPEAEISQVLKNYGEERFARAIARKIVKCRAQSPLQRTGELAELIAEVIPRHDSGLNPATRSFQGIRIFINHELEELEQFLPEAMAVLRAGGRLAIISFHSLEDRMVKRFFRADAFRVSSDLPLRATEIPPLPWCAVGKAIHASTEEIQRNPRSRSAVLRVAERSERHAA